MIVFKGVHPTIKQPYGLTICERDVAYIEQYADTTTVASTFLNKYGERDFWRFVTRSFTKTYQKGEIK